MSTPKTVTDASSDLDEAVLNLFLRAGKLQVKVNYAAIQFVAATNTPEVLAAIDSDGEIITADLSWNAGTTELQVTLSGFTVRPLCLVTFARGGNGSTNIGAVQMQSASTTLADIRFAGAGAGDNNALDPNGDMVINVLIIGV